MGLFVTVLIGLIAGFLAAKILGLKVSFWIGMLLGVAGSILGGWITSLLLGVDLTSGFNLTTIIVSVLGAILVVFLYRLIKK